MKTIEHKILIVDDELEFLNLIHEILSAEGYKVLTAINGKEALKKLAEEGLFSLIISDYKMPVMKGTDFLETAKKLYPNTPRIIVTAYQNAEMMEESINKAEVFYFLSKPIDINKTLSIIKSGIKRYEDTLKKEEIVAEKDRLIFTIKNALEQSPVFNHDSSDKKTSENKKKAEDDKITVDMLDMLAALSTALDIINPALNDHHKRTCYIASCLASELELSTKDISTVFIASIIHDIGAIALSDRFKLLDFEEKSPHGHAELGALLLESFPPFAPFAPLVRYHHVDWDHGAGEVFKGKTVHPLSHLIHLADRIAVLIKNEPHVIKQIPKIEEIIFSKTGNRFKPEYVNAFSRISKQESFWMDAVSPNLDIILREKSQLPDISLDLNGVEQLASFFSNIVDTRSHFTANHSSGVSATAEKLAKLMKMSSSECQEMKIAGFLHDLGKLAVSDKILEKDGPLDEEERSVMKTHTYHTYSILSKVKGLENIATWASYHHETLTGDGYPFRIKPGALTLGSRVLAVADIFTALTENRPYRVGMDKEKVEDIFYNMTEERKIDSNIVSVLMSNYEEVNQIRKEAQEKQDGELSGFWNKHNELAKTE
jgi:response regulator RpfG family c-di-GMP phosphodiesterase